jgi:hypothetical protein
MLASLECGCTRRNEDICEGLLNTTLTDEYARGIVPPVFDPC